MRPRPTTSWDRDQNLGLKSRSCWSRDFK